MGRVTRSRRESRKAGKESVEHFVRIRIATLEFTACFDEEAAPRTCDAFRKLLPLRKKIIHVRWSGAAGWIPMGVRFLKPCGAIVGQPLFDDHKREGTTAGVWTACPLGGRAGNPFRSPVIGSRREKVNGTAQFGGRSHNAHHTLSVKWRREARVCRKSATGDRSRQPNLDDAMAGYTPADSAAGTCFQRD